MLSAENNELLTRVGPGTGMGRLMREYWIPACRSFELEAGAPPIRLMLLGEKLIAFRDGKGRIGLMDHRCPHRGASLFFGRVEEDGVRCVYHGWRFGAEGGCREMPNVPPHQDFSAKVRSGAYRTAERNGLVWAYMGSRAEPPPLPAIEAASLAPDQVTVRCAQRECNWLQALEGDIDTSHFGFLHLGSVEAEEVDPHDMHVHNLLDRAPEYNVRATPWGTMYCAHRPADPGFTYYRFAHFAFPFWTLFPDGTFSDHIAAQAWVPVDDTHTMVFTFNYVGRTSALRTNRQGELLPGLEDNNAFLPNGTGWRERWRRVAGRANDYNIDRSLQRDGSYSGISSVPVQDQAIIESMGEIVDRSREHLAPSDRMVIQTRRRMLDAVRSLQRDGATPPAVDDPEVCRAARGGAFVTDSGQDWLDAYAEQCRAAVSPDGFLQPRDLRAA